MIKEEMRYICPVCNEEYDTKSKAEECSKSHVQNLSAEYRWIRNDPLPYSIRLTNSKGQHGVYIRVPC